MSPRIQLLDENVANKIAAGEVIERPASVVKELVENAIDAGSTRILIEVRGGGKDLMRIVDDGCGMDEDDALLAFDRHATSKIRAFEDLEQVVSLGFRGEALPSIASVSRLTLATSTADDQAGTRVIIHGGKLLSVDRVPLPTGTSVEVANLFFNTPARRKFLKAPVTEFAHITEMISNLAMAHPGLNFRLLHDQHLVLDCPPAATFIERVGQIIGQGRAQELLPLAFRQTGLTIQGGISSPDATHAQRRFQAIFINGRPVRDRIISNAIYLAYRGKIPEGRHPMVYLHLAVDPQAVDVNVHPTKIEVRFIDSNWIHENVYRAALQVLERALYDHFKRRQEQQIPILNQHPTDGDRQAPTTAGEEAPDRRRSVTLSLHRSATYSQQPSTSPSFNQSAPLSPRVNLPSTPPTAHSSASEMRGLGTNATQSADDSINQQPSETGIESQSTSPQLPGLTTPVPRVVGQLDSSYILAEDGHDLLILDQHAAHERILYDKFRRMREQGQVPVQHLLVPITLPVNPIEEQILGLFQRQLAELGFEVEPFGPKTYLIRSVPAAVAHRDPRDLVPDLISELMHTGSSQRTQAELDEIAALAACKAAVKANTRFAIDELQHLVNDLYTTDNPGTCPHGRPVALRISRRDIERSFLRS